MGRAPCCEKVGLKKGRWTAEEDEILAKYIQANGEGSWRSLPKNAGLLRCGKSCRLRWINYLRADLKRGNITAEEENTIVKLHASFGNRWSLIASHLAGRTDNEIKNYWNSHLSRKIYSFTGAGAGGAMDITPKVVASIPPKRKAGRTSRWAMKKNKTYTQNINANANDTTITHRPKQNSDAAVKAPEAADVAEAVDEEITDDDVVVSGPCDELEDFINDEGGGALGFIDNTLESCLAETCGVWDLVLSEERESNDDVGNNKKASSELSLESDQHWDWESLIEFNDYNWAEQQEIGSSINHNVVDYSEGCSNTTNWAEQQEKLLTWLWEEDDDWESDSSKRLGETDTTRILQDDKIMVDWFLSPPVIN